MNKKHRAASLLAIFLCLFTMPAYAVSCLLFPLGCLKPKKKYGEEMEALVLNLSGKQTEYYHIDASGTYHGAGLDTTREYYIWFKVGETLYQARRDETLLQMGYKPKRADWIGRTAKLRFRDQKWLGVKSAWAVFDRGKGKEWEFVLVSIIGPDGVDECKGRLMCPHQAEVDRAAREQEQLAKLGKTGTKSASDVEPMPVDLPPEPATAAPPVAASVATPAEGGAPSTELEPAGQQVPADDGAPAIEPASPAGQAPQSPDTVEQAPPGSGPDFS